MAKEFVVEVIAPPAGDDGAVAERLGRSFNLPSTKVAALLRRLPDVVTKPITEREANAVARRFQQAGLEAVVRPSVPEGVGSVAVPAAPPPPPGPFESAPAEADPDLGAAPRAGELDPAEVRARLEAQRAAAAPTPATPPAGAPPEPPAAAPGGVGRPPAPVPEPAHDPVPPAAPAETRVVEPAEADGAAPGKRSRRGRRPRRRGSLRAKMVSAAVLPTLLAIAGALAAVWFTARPALYEQLLDSARNPAIATAASLSSTLEEGNEGGGGEGIDYLQLQETIQITRQAFARENISFVVATDNEGNPLSGWFAGGGAFGADTLQLQSAIRDQAIAAVARTGATSRGESASVQLEGEGRNRIEIVAQPLVAGGRSFGAIVVGIRDDAVNQQVLRILATILLFSLIPLALALLIAYARSRRVTENVLSLTRKADEISRGDLDEEVAIRSNDELEDLAEALERMRVSMKGAIERLRRRR